MGKILNVKRPELFKFIWKGELIKCYYYEIDFEFNLVDI